jgi:hypothetical protein
MREIHDDYRKNTDDMGAKGSARQLMALEVWFDLATGTRYAKAMVGNPPRPDCVKLKLVPVREEAELDRVSVEEYRQALETAKRTGTQWFLRHAGRDPKSPMYDSLLSSRIIMWGSESPLVDQGGCPFSPMKMPDDLKPHFSREA